MLGTMGYEARVSCLHVFVYELEVLEECNYSVLDLTESSPLCIRTSITSNDSCKFLHTTAYWRMAGSGKTYRMQPWPLRACEDVMVTMQSPCDLHQGLQLRLSFFKAYGGKLHDLLNTSRCVDCLLSTCMLAWYVWLLK